MTDEPHEPGDFLAELRRRHVVRVGIAYLVVAWAVIEVAATVVPHLALPESMVTVIIVLAGLGLPIALILAWAFEVTPEGVRQTASGAGEAPSGATAGTKLGRPSVRPMLLVVVGAVAGALIVRIAVPDAPPAAGTADAATGGADVVAVMPFAVRGGAEVEDLREGMVSLLSTKLDGAGDLRSVDSRALLSLIEREPLPEGDVAAAYAVAGRFGAGHIVLGDVVEAGGQLQISAAVYGAGASGEPTSEATVEGEVSRLFQLVDQLAADLLAGMSGGPAARVRGIAAVTTDSLPALKAFLQGEKLARGAQFGAAVEAFQRAVEIDPSFGLAHYRLALAAEWNLQDDLARSAAEEAVRHADRLAERDRRLLEAFLVRRRGANEEAEDLYRSILGTYPDELEAWIDLTEVLFHASPLRGESFTRARDALERVLFFDPTHSTSLIHLARVTAFEGREAELDTLVGKFLSLNPEADRGFEIRALHAFATDDEDAEARVLSDLESADDLSVALAAWDVAVFARDLDGAEMLARLLTVPTRSPEARTLGHAWLAHVLLARGRLDDADRELDELAAWNPGAALEYRALSRALPFIDRDAAELEEVRNRLARSDPSRIPTSRNPSVVFTAHDRLHEPVREYLLGLLSARLGDAAAAADHAGRVEAMEVPTTAGSLPSDLARSIRAQAALAGGRPAEALALLEGARMETWYGQTLASPYYAQVMERWVRAEALLALDRPEEARRWLEHIAELSPFELPYLAPSYLRLAEIDRRAGRTRQAAAYEDGAEAVWTETPLGPLRDALERGAARGAVSGR